MNDWRKPTGNNKIDSTKEDILEKYEDVYKCDKCDYKNTSEKYVKAHQTRKHKKRDDTDIPQIDGFEDSLDLVT